MDKEALAALLHHEIPMTRAMGIEVEEMDESGLTLTAPLSLNDNHKATAFGGSLNTLAITAAWSLIQSRLMQANIKAQVVIQQSQCHYLQPVNRDLRSRALPPTEQDWQKFIKTLNKHGRGRIQVHCISEYDGVNALDYQGSYVAIVV